MFEIQQRETNPSFNREADGGGFTDDTLLPWKRDCSHRLTALSPLDPNGRIPIRVRVVCTSSGNRAPLNSIHRDPNGEKPIRLTRRGYGNVSKEVEQ